MVSSPHFGTEKPRLFIAIVIGGGTSLRMVTEVRIRLTDKPPILAFVAVTLWNKFVVHDLRVLERQDGSRVVLMPRLQGSDGVWSTIAHPVREEARLEIRDAVMLSFEHAVAARDGAQAMA